MLGRVVETSADTPSSPPALCSTDHPPYPCVGVVLWSHTSTGAAAAAAAAGLKLNLLACSQPASSTSSGRAGVWSLSGEHRCAKPLEYPCAGEARTDHRGGLSLSSRQKGKSHGESMAVEEEGLRVFQSVKIKIGKKKNPYPQSERLNGWLHINGPSRQCGLETGGGTDLSCSCCYCNSNHTFSSQRADCKPQIIKLKM